MSPDRNDRDLIAVLESLRPAPDPKFAKDLDARAAEGFPRPSTGSPTPKRWRDRLSGFRWARAIAPAGAAAVLAIAIATAAVSLSDTGGEPAGDGGSSPGFLNGTSEAVQSAPEGGGASMARAGDSAANEGEAISGAASAAAPATRDREIERSARIVLEAEPSEVREASGRVYAVVRDHAGIVLRSSVRDRGDGEAVASFALLIPSGQLDEAMAGFSEISTVRSRSDSTTDVTAPTVDLEQRLRDVRADIDRLLTELAEAETETDRGAIERRLRTERDRAAYISSRLDRLEERVRFSRVSLGIVSAPAGDEEGAWGVDDAVDDAGRILGVAAGVTLIALAVLAPIAIIVLLARAGHRAWRRRARERALNRPRPST